MDSIGLEFARNEMSSWRSIPSHAPSLILLDLLLCDAVSEEIFSLSGKEPDVGLLMHSHWSEFAKRGTCRWRTRPRNTKKTIMLERMESRRLLSAPGSIPAAGPPAGPGAAETAPPPAIHPSPAAPGPAHGPSVGAPGSSPSGGATPPSNTPPGQAKKAAASPPASTPPTPPSNTPPGQAKKQAATPAPAPPSHTPPGQAKKGAPGSPPTPPSGPSWPVACGTSRTRRAGASRQRITNRRPRSQPERGERNGTDHSVNRRLRLRTWFDASQHLVRYARQRTRSTREGRSDRSASQPGSKLQSRSCVNETRKPGRCQRRHLRSVRDTVRLLQCE